MTHNDLAIAAERQYRTLKDVPQRGIGAARVIADKLHGGTYCRRNGRRTKVNTYAIARSILAAIQRADLRKGGGYVSRGVYHGVALVLNPITDKYQVCYLPLFNED